MDAYNKYKSRCLELKNDKSGIFEYKDFETYLFFQDILSEEEFTDVLRDKHNRSCKRSRTASKLSDMLRFRSYYKIYYNKDYHLVFGTCTFNNQYLKERKERTRVKLLEIYLKKHYEVCILNKDFGDKTEREHYHFIGLTEENYEPLFKQDGTPKKSKKGYSMYELLNKDYNLGHEPTIVPIVEIDTEKLKNYLLKLNNHSSKVTTKQRLRHIKNHTYQMWERIQNVSKREKEIKRDYLYKKLNISDK